jgi:AcrR family transcriptional regulator
MAAGPRAVEGARTRAKLVDAGRKLFAAQGYNPTTVAQVAEEAGAHPGSLYHAFSAKQDLLVAVLEDYLTQLDTRVVGPAWDGVDDPIERVFALLGIYRKFLAGTDCAFGCPIGSLALELHEPDAAVRELLAKNFCNWVDRVHACLEAAGPRLPDGTDRRQLATFVLTTMEGGVMLARTERSLAAFDASVAMLREYFSLLESLAGRQTYGRAWRG